MALTAAALGVGAGEEAGRGAGGAGTAAQPAGASCGVSAGELLEQRGAGLHDVQALGWGQGALQDGEGGAASLLAQLGITEHPGVRWQRGGWGLCWRGESGVGVGGWVAGADPRYPGQERS